MLSRDEARRHYDRFGARQDRQAFYEDAALDLLVAKGDFGDARAVVEVGCGTGRFAERLLRDELDPGAAYRGFDLSSTMVGLARDRLTGFSPRARVDETDGSLRLDLPAGRYDRFVATYVIEVLSPEDQRQLLAEARRLLEPGGRLCLASITRGCSLLSRAVMGVWNAVYMARSRTVGGCRPVSSRELLGDSEWAIDCHEVTSRWGIASEVLVARRSGA